MKMRVAVATVTAAAAVALALFAAACASRAESPTPSEQAPTSAASRAAAPAPSPASSTVASPGAGRTVCPTPPGTDVGSPTYSSAVGGQATLIGVRTESAACGDRITFSFEGALPAYDVKAMASGSTCAKGDVITPQGAGHLIMVRFGSTNAHDDAGMPTAPRSLTPALPSLWEVRQTCDFEAVVSYALIAAARPVSVTTTASPPSLVVEIAH
ncbi:MAG: hypothetical protein IVW36_03680 [Dehalococcoidia bacterium]|nr:hypothetical protein [Dehalococcoidia bacterium]